MDPITQGLDPVTQGHVPYYGKRSADADAFYGYPYAAYAYGYPYAHAYVPFGSSTGLDPITQGLDPVTQGHVVKRSADADAFYAGYGYPYTYGYVPFGSSTGLDPITQGLDPATQGYLPYGYYHHYWVIWKLEIEANLLNFIYNLWIWRHWHDSVILEMFS